MVNERGIETDPDTIRAILDMPTPEDRERDQRLLGKSQPTVWDDQCQRAFERIREYLLSPPVLVPPTLGRLLPLYLSVSDVKSIRWSIVADHLASLLIFYGRAIDDDFPNEDVVVVTSLSGWRMYFDGAANHFGYGIGVLLRSPHGLERALKLGIRQMEVFGDSKYGIKIDSRVHNQFADALATLASMIDIPVDTLFAFY
ncbi:hypothetical protein CK203_079087 [Vitis vinifera]|uniref:RNase H type-1 domain-containing protein n=1 Tax=Vitis vinifera TaxID=29760 RepID=A0A438BYK3_VITVI|nr:hypothetical protein CK203_079087 [Vitis vinifera]